MNIEQALTDHLNNSGLLGSGYDLFLAGVAVALLAGLALARMEAVRELDSRHLSRVADDSGGSSGKTTYDLTGRRRINSIVGAVAFVLAVAVTATAFIAYFTSRSNAQESATAAWQTVERELLELYEIDGASPMDENLDPVLTTDKELRNWTTDLANTLDSVAEPGAHVTVQTHDEERHTYQLTAYGGRLSLLDDSGTAVEPNELLRENINAKHAEGSGSSTTAR